MRDRRWVQDGRVISTTGVSASIPAGLALVEAIAGRQAAEATAARLGAGDWSPRHRTAEFKTERSDYVVGAANRASTRSRWRSRPTHGVAACARRSSSLAPARFGLAMA
ncbi:MAG: hypothetical protein JF617_04455 [Burkholderiales bacterium]|nr:hypothetical protein [Burkholderiales bacterium]